MSLSKSKVHEGDVAAVGDVPLELPVEIWDKILNIVRHRDNYTQDDLAACRLVCGQWKDLVDKLRLTPRGYVWNPYFLTTGNEDAEALVDLGRTNGIYLSTAHELEQVLADWENPQTKPLLSKTLIVDFMNTEDYLDVCRRFPAVVEKLAAHIEDFKVAVEPLIPSSREILLKILKMNNLSSLTVYLKGPFNDDAYSNADPILEEWLSQTLAITPQVVNNRLVELRMLGDRGRYSADFFKLCSRITGNHIKNLQFVGDSLRNDDTKLSSLLNLYQNVDTVKVTSGDAWDWATLEQLPLFHPWNIRRLSLNFQSSYVVKMDSLSNLFSELYRRNNETLEELHLMFSNRNSRLRDGRIISTPAGKSSFNLTKLSLPFLMTRYPKLLEEIVVACPKLIYLTLVVTDDGLVAGEEMTPKQVEAVVQMWRYAPPSVKWIAVKYR